MPPSIRREKLPSKKPPSIIFLLLFSPLHLSPPPLASPCSAFLFLCTFSPCQRLHIHITYTQHTQKQRGPMSVGAGDHNLWPFVQFMGLYTAAQWMTVAVWHSYRKTLLLLLHPEVTVWAPAALLSNWTTWASLLLPHISELWPLMTLYSVHRSSFLDCFCRFWPLQNGNTPQKLQFWKMLWPVSGHDLVYSCLSSFSFLHVS